MVGFGLPSPSFPLPESTLLICDLTKVSDSIRPKRPILERERTESNMTFDDLSRVSLTGRLSLPTNSRRDSRLSMTGGGGRNSTLTGPLAGPPDSTMTFPGLSQVSLSGNDLAQVPA